MRSINLASILLYIVSSLFISNAAFAKDRNPCNDKGDLKGWAKRKGYSSELCQPATNTTPSITITSPSNASSVLEGTRLDFIAQANDREDGNLSSSVRWSSSLDQSISSSSTLSVGSHVITASVTDSGGLSSSAKINVLVEPQPVNTAPSVTIVSPADNDSIEEGTSLSFTAQANDQEDGNLSSLVQWSSSLDQSISSTSTLSVGSHVITASVTDSGGLQSFDQITVEVFAEPVNTGPTLSILSPAGGTSVEEGSLITFVARASDEQDGDLSDAVTWHSSLDQSISSNTTLSVGSHIITARVVDSEGLDSYTQINVEVLPSSVNTEPTLALLSPQDDSVVEDGTVTQFIANAFDEEDGDLSNVINWQSSIDGQLFADQALSVGVHEITASVTDSNGAIVTASVTIEVVEVSEPATHTEVQLNWELPLYREDGSVLAMDEISGFEIVMIEDNTGTESALSLAGNNITQHSLEVENGNTYYFAISAYDTNGRYSSPSDPVQITVE